MRACSVGLEGRSSYGLLCDGGFAEASAGLREQYPDLKSLLAGTALSALSDAVEETVALDSVRFLPVIPNPGKILCVGVNYRPHVEEMGRDIPSHPVVFVRFADSLVGHDRPVSRPRISEHYDFEGELAVVIGKPARYVGADAALDHVAGFCPFLDGSVRDWQRHTSQFTAGKNFPASGALGPALVTPDELPGGLSGLGDVELTTSVSGEVMQRGRVSDLIFDVPRLIEYCSSFAALEPGDVIATGTPGGVGAARTPPRWLTPGDVVDVDLGPLGRLRNAVVAEEKRD